MKNTINTNATIVMPTNNLVNIKAKTEPLVRKLMAQLEQENAIRASFDMPARKWTLGTIPMEYINFGPCYQREGNKMKKLDMAVNYDTDLEEPITLVYNPITGYFDCTDGGHRGWSQMKNGYKFTEARNFFGMSVEEAANLFVKLNSSRLNVNAVAKFNADIIAKKTYALDIKALCEEYGLTIKATGAKKVDRNIGSISILTKTYKAKGYGLGALRFMFDLMRDSGWMDIAGGMAHDYLLVAYHAYKYCKDDGQMRATMVIKMQALAPDSFVGAAKHMYSTMCGKHGEGSIPYYVRYILTGKE